MRFFVFKLAVLALFTSRTACAANLWDGQWDLVPAAGHKAAHSFLLEKLSNGAWRYDSGYVLDVLDPSGRAFPEPLSPDYTIVTRELSERTLSFEEWLGGALQETTSWTLSANGQRLEGFVTTFDLSGRGQSRQVVALRVGSGSGLEGRWCELAAPDAPSPRQPYWTISSHQNGVMIWTIPATGEVLKGSADGRQYPLIGRGQPPGKTFAFVRLSPRHLIFSAFERGRLVEQADESLSLDGKRWTEWIWTPVFPTERDLRVFWRRDRPF